MSVRKAQIESTLRRAVSEVLLRHRAADPRIAGMVSVTRVDVSPDLRQGMVYVTVLPEQYQKRTLAGLRNASRFIQGEAAKSMTIKTMPHLDFRLDGSLKKEAAIFDAIRRGVTREDGRKKDDADPGAPQGPAAMTDAPDAPGDDAADRAAAGPNDDAGAADAIDPTSHDSPAAEDRRP